MALFGMLLVFTYWFGVWGFIAFPDKFQFRRAEVMDGSTVQNSVETGWGNSRAVPLQYVWQGMIMVVDQGVRKDDVGEALDKFNWPSPCPNPAEYGCKPCPGLSITYDCILDRGEDGSAPCLDEGAIYSLSENHGACTYCVRTCLVACMPRAVSRICLMSFPFTWPPTFISFHTQFLSLAPSPYTGQTGWLAKLDDYLALEECADVFTSLPQYKIFIRVVYTFLFFVAVSAIGLEIVFGIFL